MRAMAHRIVSCASRAQTSNKIRHYAATELLMRLLAAHFGLVAALPEIALLRNYKENDPDVLYLLGYLQDIVQTWWNPLRVGLLARWLSDGKWEVPITQEDASGMSFDLCGIWESSACYHAAINSLCESINDNNPEAVLFYLHEIRKHSFVMAMLDYSPDWCEQNRPYVLRSPAESVYE